MTLLRTALIGDINLTYQAWVPKSEPTDNAPPNGSRVSCGRHGRGTKLVHRGLHPQHGAKFVLAEESRHTAV